MYICIFCLIKSLPTTMRQAYFNIILQMRKAGIKVVKNTAIWLHFFSVLFFLSYTIDPQVIKVFEVILFYFLKFKFIYFNWRLITLQYCIGFAIHQHESAMGIHVLPILNPPSHLPPRTIPLGHPSAPAPSILYPALNLDWRFIYHMILYMFQCHYPKSSPLSVSHRIQKTVLYICVSFAVLHTGLSLPSF